MVLVAGSETAAAHRLDLSHSTVKHHLANARSKVGAATTVQLVCGSWRGGCRSPSSEAQRKIGGLPEGRPRASGGLLQPVLKVSLPFRG